ncbi:hypothetical protein DCS_00058 [Drechmeria coniospora]|uniref:MARVEL domain-containing protein n=1 Tax=Drechmeria coniospora TaxID=98403 RepID=A0A151GPE3_DRECN|nr:hypothetical protein DCS_00058 [Drechmeria coniospora]KYK58931.1 hypothetical protein DCS_00058 [Drechmeria coniospora]ODA76447.1 hypothetical protein RJ55_07716 [Drechmeria coniospora]
MAHGTGTFRALASFCHFMIFASAAIVMGIISYFLSQYPFRGSHVVYQEVISVITVAFYMVAMILPCFKSYEGYFLPLNFFFSYLWLTSFIFSVNDWSGNLCRRDIYGEPGLDGERCSLKRTVESFNFFAFFFLICNIIIEAFLWRASRKVRHDEERQQHSSAKLTKERPAAANVSGHGAPTAPPTTAPAGNVVPGTNGAPEATVQA